MQTQQQLEGADVAINALATKNQGLEAEVQTLRDLNSRFLARLGAQTVCDAEAKFANMAANYEQRISDLKDSVASLEDSLRAGSGVDSSDGSASGSLADEVDFRDNDCLAGFKTVLMGVP